MVPIVLERPQEYFDERKYEITLLLNTGAALFQVEL